jgi:hypothetical protein
MKPIFHATESDLIAFGKIILLWGHVEANLAGILLSLYHPYNQIQDRGGVPIKFSTKIRHAIHGYCNVRRMAPIRKEAKALINSLIPLHEQRSIIAHGYYQGVHGEGLGYHEFGLYESRDGERKRWRFHNFTGPQLQRLTSDIAKAWTDMEDLSAKTYRIAMSK